MGCHIRTRSRNNILPCTDDQNAQPRFAKCTNRDTQARNRASSTETSTTTQSATGVSWNESYTSALKPGDCTMETQALNWLTDGAKNKQLQENETPPRRPPAPFPKSSEVGSEQEPEPGPSRTTLNEENAISQRRTQRAPSWPKSAPRQTQNSRH